MLPHTAPAHGPGSSADINHDRAALSYAIHDLSFQIPRLPQVIDPDANMLAFPDLPSALQIGLPGGRVIVEGRIARVAPMSFSLPAHSETYIDVARTGQGLASDWPGGSVVYQTAGSFAGTSHVAVPVLQAASAIDISSGLTFSQQYVGQFTSANGSWGPAILDALGNGYVARTSSGTGGFFAVQGFTVASDALAELATNQANAGGVHQLLLQTTYDGSIDGGYTHNYTFTLTLDGQPQPALTYAVTDSQLAPQAVFPAFFSAGGVVYFTSWSWYNEQSLPVAGWVLSSAPAGAPEPPLQGRRFFQVSTGTQPLLIRDRFTERQVATRITALRNTLTSLAEAYL